MYYARHARTAVRYRRRNINALIRYAQTVDYEQSRLWLQEVKTSGNRLDQRLRLLRNGRSRGYIIDSRT